MARLSNFFLPHSKHQGRVQSIVSTVYKLKEVHTVEHQDLGYFGDSINGAECILLLGKEDALAAAILHCCPCPCFSSLGYLKIT